MNKKGRGIKDFIKNNKKALGIGAATIALLSLYNHKQRNPDYIPDYKKDLEKFLGHEDLESNRVKLFTAIYTDRYDGASSIKKEAAK